jgi:hypothetical protein
MVNNNHGKVNSKSNHSQYFNGYASHFYIGLDLVFLKLSAYNILKGRGDRDFMVGFISQLTTIFKNL